jgi:hypothetical protein
MKTKGKGNEPQKKTCRPSPNFHPFNPKELHLESLNEVFTIDRVNGHLLFFKIVHMEEWKATKD